MDWEIELYCDSKGNVPVKDFILMQAPKAKAKILHYLDLLKQFGLTLGQPYTKKLAGTDIWELRIHHSSNYYRILYFAFTGRKFILLHSFLKKAKKTPKSEIMIAMDRISDYKQRYSHLNY